MASRRPSVPIKLVTQVGLISRRRCCLCFGFRFDTSYKRIQIAHIDHNPKNNRLGNLVALCPEHHDEYDSTPRLTKGITSGELRRHRDGLSQMLQQVETKLRFDVEEQGTPTKYVVSAKLLGEVVAAYDSDFERVEEYANVNGMKLLSLGRDALKDEGDFEVAKEALRSLTRIAQALWLKRPHWPTFTPMPVATPTSSAVGLLRCMQLDGHLLGACAMELLHHGLGLGVDANAAATPSFEPGARYYVSANILWLGATTLTQAWARQYCFSAIRNLLMAGAVGFAFAHRNYPSPPFWDWLRRDELFRTRPDIEDAYWPFLILVHRVAQLPDESFDWFCATLRSTSNGIPRLVVSDRGMSAEEARRKLHRNAALLFWHSDGSLHVKDEGARVECEEYVAVLARDCNSAFDELRSMLVKHRAAFVSQTPSDKIMLGRF